MKTGYWQVLVALMVVTGITFSGAIVVAQNSAVATSGQSVTTSMPAPQLSFGTAQILKLKQAEIGDDTVIAFIKTSKTSYDLDADQIIYLKQQGVSDSVVSAMLQQPRTQGNYAMAVTPTPQPEFSPTDTAQVSQAPVAPAVTYVQTVPTTYYYSQPYYTPSGAFICYPSVGVSFGWYGGSWCGSGWHGGGYYYGGGHGGGYNGGGHGGGFGGGGHYGWHH